MVMTSRSVHSPISKGRKQVGVQTSWVFEPVSCRRLAMVPGPLLQPDFVAAGAIALSSSGRSDLGLTLPPLNHRFDLINLAAVTSK